MVENYKNSEEIQYLLNLYREKKCGKLIKKCTHYLQKAKENPSVRPEIKVLFHELRGFAYAYKGDHETAAKNLKDAIELQPERADLYLFLGIEHACNGKDECAEENFTKFKNLSAGDKKIYHRLGLAYLRIVLVYNNKRDSDRTDKFHNPARENLKEALKLEPENTEILCDFGLLLLIKGENDKEALTHYRNANDIDQELKSRDIGCYIASKLDSADMFSDLYSLASSVLDIKKELIRKSSKKSKFIAHYTNLSSVKKLVPKNPREPFRLYNAAYMNDPEEGKTLLDWFIENGLSGNNGETKDFLSKGARSPAYVGSFVQIKPGNPLDDEKLFLWRTHGRHEGQEANGACLCFSIRNFSGDPPMELDAMKLDETSLKGHQQSNIEFQKLQGDCIYEIVYKSGIENFKRGKLKDILMILTEKLDNIIRNGELDEKKLARSMLDEIRFLFKEDHYREEEELRIVKIQNFNDELPEDVKVDIDRFPPRFYMEVSDQLQLKKVILGPQVKAFAGWKEWIKTENSDLKVKQSKIPYTSDYS